MTVQLYSPLIIVHVRASVGKGEFFRVNGLPEGMRPVGATVPITIAPITMLLGDELLIDTRDGVLHTVTRGGIVVWREAWKN